MVMIVFAARGAIWWELKQGHTPTRCVVFGTLVLLCVYAFVWAGVRLFFRQDLIWIWQKEFEASLQATAAMYVELGLESAEVKRSTDFIRLFFMYGAPGWLLALTLGLSLAVFLWLRKRARHLTGAEIPIPAFNRWQLPEYLVWPVIFSLVFILLGSRGVKWAGWIGFNGVIVLGSICFVIGLAVTGFLVARWKLPRFVRVFGVMLLFFFPILIVMLALLGLLDTWWDVRKLRAASLGKE